MRPERKPTVAEYSELWMARMMRYMPVEWVSAVGGLLGTRYGRKGIAAGCPWVKRLHANLERFSGITDPAQRERRIIEYTCRFGRIYAEFMTLQRIAETGRLELAGRENLAGLSKPAILFSAHMANWELVGHVLTLLDRPTAALYDPPENPVRRRLAVEARARWRADLELVPASPKAMVQITKAVAAGRNLLMYVDELRDGRVWAPSLGRALPYAGNRWLTARLAVRYKADLVPVHVEAVGNVSYRIIIEPKLVAAQGDAESQARSLADQMGAYVETWVRAHPEHWYWLNDFDLAKPLARS